MTTTDDLQTWLDSMESVETLAEDVLAAAKHQGAKIKNGSKTEVVLREWIKEGLSRAIALEQRNARRKRAAARERLRRRNARVAQR